MLDNATGGWGGITVHMTRVGVVTLLKMNDLAIRGTTAATWS